MFPNLVRKQLIQCWCISQICFVPDDCANRCGIRWAPLAVSSPTWSATRGWNVTYSEFHWWNRCCTSVASVVALKCNAAHACRTTAPLHGIWKKDPGWTSAANESCPKWVVCAIDYSVLRLLNFLNILATVTYSRKQFTVRVFNVCYNTDENVLRLQRNFSSHVWSINV